VPFYTVNLEGFGENRLKNNAFFPVASQEDHMPPSACSSVIPLLLQDLSSQERQTYQEVISQSDVRNGQDCTTEAFRKQEIGKAFLRCQ
jgi:hypothetical protein